MQKVDGAENQHIWLGALSRASIATSVSLLRGRGTGGCCD